MEGANEESGGGDQEQRDGDLGDDEDVTQAEGDSEAASRAGSGGAGFFEGGGDVDAGGLDGRGEAEEDAGGERDEEGEAQDAPVEFCAQGEIFVAVGEEPGEEADAQRGDEDAEGGSGEGEQNGLSVSICRMTRRRPAPRLSRTAISRRRATARASRRLAMLAQAMSRIRPTIVIRM